MDINVDVIGSQQERESADLKEVVPSIGGGYARKKVIVKPGREKERELPLGEWPTPGMTSCVVREVVEN